MRLRAACCFSREQVICITCSRVAFTSSCNRPHCLVIDRLGVLSIMKTAQPAAIAGRPLRKVCFRPLAKNLWRCLVDPVEKLVELLLKNGMRRGQMPRYLKVFVQKENHVGGMRRAQKFGRRVGGKKRNQRFKLHRTAGFEGWKDLISRPA